ncbi:MAG: bifunctional ADP-dependent NAD(P)H-hydrate dehydratase/NAD(P)H-hydrate epimerase [Candidatus Rokuibacteriota bacterium]|nr:MAG: bifunctional ADP-dependent NAD(P)H-hydrate dehydratase/NAD(P)H-hydrate epimerase [Candidatus Rokubacteria bacterium]
MRALDRRAVEHLGIPGATLMENAGRGAAAEIRAFLRRRGQPVRGLGVVVVCGKGNNGGDGFVVARILAGWGARARVFLAGRAEDVRGDAALKLAQLGRARIRPVDITDPGGMAQLKHALASCGLVVDALLGTGVSGPAHGPIADAIDRINECGVPVVALDLPSGLSSDTGDASGTVVRAALTTTFAGLKRGLLLPPGRDLAGEVVVVPIGVPAAETLRGAGVFMLDAADILRELPARRRDAHKGDFGRLLIVAGSVGKTGAAALAGRAAMRTGAGLVTIATPRSQQPILAALVTEPMTEPLAETAVQTIALGAKDHLLALAAARDAVALGPGLGLDGETQTLVRDLVRDLPAPMVIDADALTALAGHLDRLTHARGPRCLTPHPGEMARMLGVSVASVQADRIETARRSATTYNAHIVLKGHTSVISAPGGPTFLNPTGNPGMASGGTGDVLTGMVGAFLARGRAPLAALCCATYLHGLAGDLVAQAKGEEGLIAGDLIEAIPEAIRQIQRSVADG